MMIFCRIFFFNIYWYNVLFKDKVKELVRFEVVEDIYLRRVKVVLIKLKYGKDENFGILEIVILK